MDEMWPIISNRDVIFVNQAWADSPGKRLAVHGKVSRVRLMLAVAAGSLH